MRTPHRGPVSLALPLACAGLLATAEAKATDATEIPDNGSEQGMRGGAWVARASDPLAAFYNPAGLAGQPTRLILQANLPSQRTCFSRIKASNDTTADHVMPGGSYPQSCNDAAYGVVPQLAITLRLTPRIGLGIAPLLSPSGTNGQTNYPEFSTYGTPPTPNQPEPGRYLLMNQSVLLVTPTIALGVELIDRLRVGASFQLGIATFSFTNASMGLNGDNFNAAAGDLKEKLSGKEIFIPGFTLGTIWSPTDNLDIAGWYKFSAPIDASGDVNVQYGYFANRASNMQTTNPPPSTDSSQPDCLPAGSPPPMSGSKTICGSGSNASIHLSRPMEAKIGARFHLPRKNIAYDEHLRDPIAQDVFDAEVDLTWANDSAMDLLQIRFPGSTGVGQGSGVIPINGTVGYVPPNDDIPLHYSDVFGIRIGGDYNVMPDRVALRGGGFYQTAAQTGTNTQYQGLGFTTGSLFGLALGGTYRIHFGPGSNALELSAGFEHVFVGDETYTGTGGIPAIAGSQYPCGPKTAAGFVCSGGGNATTKLNFRSNWAINLGTISNSINVVNAGLGYRF